MNLQELVAGFRTVAIASIADSVDKVAGRRGYLDHDIRPRVNDRRVVGPAVTVREGPEPNAGPPQHALDLIDAADPGSVMVIAIDGEPNVAIWGGLMTAGAFARGFAGAILDGGVRDVSEIKRDYDFPVFARSISPGSTVGRFKTLGGNIPIRDRRRWRSIPATSWWPTATAQSACRARTLRRCLRWHWKSTPGRRSRQS